MERRRFNQARHDTPLFPDILHFDHLGSIECDHERFLTDDLDDGVLDESVLIVVNGRYRSKGEIRIIEFQSFPVAVNPSERQDRFRPGPRVDRSAVLRRKFR